MNIVLTILGGLVVIGIALIFLIVSLSALLSVLAGSQFVGTPGRLFGTIKQFAQLAPGDKFVELGSGMGTLCRYLAKETAADVTGIDINPVLILYSRWMSRDNRDVRFTLGSLYRADLTHVDAVYCYLLPPMLKRLAQKFSHELPRGARVISYGFPIPGKSPTKKIPATVNHGTLYLYHY